MVPPLLETWGALDSRVPMDRGALEQVTGGQHAVAGVIGRTGTELSPRMVMVGGGR